MLEKLVIHQGMLKIKRKQKQLSKIIDMKPDEIEKRLNQKKAFQVEFGQKGTNLTYQDKVKLDKMDLPGITLYPETERFYLTVILLLI